MPRRSLLHRALAAVCGVWFTVSGTVTTAIMPCAMHDGTMMAPAVDAAARPDAMAAMHAHMGHGSATPAATRPDGDGAPASDHQCTCTHDCCGVIEPVMTVAAIALATVPAQVHRRAVPATHAVHAEWRDGILPFANGPPVTRTT